MPWIAQSTAEICFKAKESTRLARLFVYRHHLEKLLGGSKKFKQAKARGSILMVITLILSTMFFLTWLGNLSVTKSSLLPTKVFVPQNFVLKGKNKLLVLFLTRSRTTSLRKQPTFRDAITGFLTKWRLRNERRNSILTTRHYTQIWVVLLIGGSKFPTQHDQ